MGRVTINPAAFLGKFESAVAVEVAAMTNALRTLEDGSFAERAQDRRGGGLMRFELANPDTIASTAGERLIRNCIRSLVSEFISYIDRLVAIKRLVSGEWPLVVKEDLVGDEAVRAFVRDGLEAAYLRVAADAGLPNRRKLTELGVTGEAERIALSMLGLRQALEHHNSVAVKGDVTVILGRLALHHNDQEILSLPHHLPGGTSLGASFVETTKTFKQGEVIQLTEGDVAQIALRLKFLAYAITDLLRQRRPEGSA